MRKSSQDLSQEEYDELVYYCRSCHSLCVVVDDALADTEWDGSYCGKCYSASVGVCKFGDWLKEEEALARKKREREWNK